MNAATFVTEPLPSTSIIVWPLNALTELMHAPSDWLCSKSTGQSYNTITTRITYIDLIYFFNNVITSTVQCIVITDAACKLLQASHIMMLCWVSLRCCMMLREPAAVTAGIDIIGYVYVCIAYNIYAAGWSC